MLGALGDIHGDLDAAWRIMRAHPDVSAWLSAGDLDDNRIVRAPPPSPLFHAKGNNEDFDFLAQVARGELEVPNFVLLANGKAVDGAGCRIVALGGTFAPTWYDTPAADLPYPGKPDMPRRVKDDKRRHFVREEVEACKALRGIDAFITHEAPRPYIVSGHDAGKTPVNEILSVMKPRLHLFGHHHRFTEATRQGVPSVGLDLASRSYLLIDTASWRYERRTLQ